MRGGLEEVSADGEGDWAGVKEDSGSTVMAGQEEEEEEAGAGRERTGVPGGDRGPDSGPEQGWVSDSKGLFKSDSGIRDRTMEGPEPASTGAGSTIRVPPAPASVLDKITNAESG